MGPRELFVCLVARRGVLLSLDRAGSLHTRVRGEGAYQLPLLQQYHHQQTNTHTLHTRARSVILLS